MQSFSEVFATPLFEFAGGSITIQSILAGIVVLVLTHVVSRAAANGAERILDRRGAESGAVFAAVKVLRYTLIFGGLMFAVGAVGFQITALVTASAALLVGVGLGLQNLFQNIAAGFVLLFEQPIRRGDYIQIENDIGEVTDIGLRATHVLTRDRVTLIVPNAELVSKRVTNLSQPSPPVRAKVLVSVPHGSDLQLVERLLLQVAEENPEVLVDPAPAVWFEAFGEWRLDFALLAWVVNAGEQPRIMSTLRFGIDRAFRENGIALAVPQQDVHIKSAPSQDRRGVA